MNHRTKGRNQKKQVNIHLSLFNLITSWRTRRISSWRGCSTSLRYVFYSFPKRAVNSFKFNWNYTSNCKQFSHSSSPLPTTKTLFPTCTSDLLPFTLTGVISALPPVPWSKILYWPYPSFFLHLPNQFSSSLKGHPSPINSPIYYP